MPDGPKVSATIDERKKEVCVDEWFNYTKRSGTWATEETARNIIYVFPLKLAHSIIPEISAN